MYNFTNIIIPITPTKWDDMDHYCNNLSRDPLTPT